VFPSLTLLPLCPWFQSRPPSARGVSIIPPSLSAERRSTRERVSGGADKTRQGWAASARSARSSRPTLKRNLLPMCPNICYPCVRSKHSAIGAPKAQEGGAEGHDFARGRQRASCRSRDTDSRGIGVSPRSTLRSFALTPECVRSSERLDAAVSKGIPEGIR
jgi:hypothetical protein